MSTESTFRQQMLRAAGLTLLVLATVAVAVDMGMVVLVRSRLQTEADASAVTAAVALADEDALPAPGRDETRDNVVELGYWDADTRTFTPTRKSRNAVRVTRQGWGPYFFARWLGHDAFIAEASAVAKTESPEPLHPLDYGVDPRIVQ